MHSKYLPWDFLRKHPKIVEPGQFGIYGFHAFDPYIEHLFLDRLPESEFEEGKIQTVLGSELTCDWVTDNFMTLGLFGANTSWLVLHAEKIPADTKRLILEKDVLVSERFLILSFAKKDDLFDQLGLRDDVVCLTVTEPPFWESSKLLNLFSNFLNLKLPYDVQNYILESIPNRCSNFVNCLNLIKLSLYDTSTIDLTLVKKIISPTKLDQFQLASLYGQKKLKLFFRKLIDLGPDFDSIRMFFIFMQRHLQRMADISYSKKKSRLSKYDKELIEHSKSWAKNDLKVAIRFFAKLEIEAKKKNPFLKDELKLEYLRMS